MERATAAASLVRRNAALQRVAGRRDDRSSPAPCSAVSIDGGLRAYSTADGKVLWQFDTNKEFQTVNGVKGTGASIDGSPLVIGGGMLFVNSGYGGIAARPGNVLLAFGVE